MGHPGVVIAGAGQAGFQTAAALRTEGYSGSITLIGDELALPYQRPPLSKGFLTGKDDEESLLLRPREFYAEHGIDSLSDSVAEIAAATREVRLESGATLTYDSLVLATGARVRPIPNAPAGVCYLRTIEDARELKSRLHDSASVVAIGAGFIGLEAAAVAVSQGKRVTVAAAEDRPMSRVVSPTISEYFAQLHKSHGVRLLLGVLVDRIETGYRVVLKSGEILDADLVVAGIGVIPNTSLATRAGLAVGDGITVDQYLRTSDPNIFAIGDCAEHPNRFVDGALCRLESVQNAVDQARLVASAITGKPRAYDAVPWFWTDQFDQKLQIAGIPTRATDFVTRGEPGSSKFSVFGFRDGLLRAVESVNRPADHILARKLLAAASPVTPSQAADTTFDLKSLLR